MSSVLSDNFRSSLLGSADPVRFFDPLRDPPVPHGETLIEPTIRYTIVIIIVSAILFVTIISIYDVIRTAVLISLNRDETLSITSSLVFSSICVVSSVILIPLLLQLAL